MEVETEEAATDDPVEIFYSSKENNGEMVAWIPKRYCEPLVTYTGWRSTMALFHNLQPLKAAIDIKSGITLSVPVHDFPEATGLALKLIFAKMGLSSNMTSA